MNQPLNNANALDAPITLMFHFVELFTARH